MWCKNSVAKLIVMRCVSVPRQHAQCGTTHERIGWLETCMRDKGGGLGWSFCVSIAGGEQGWRKERERGDVCDGRMVKGGVGVESVLFPFLC